MESSIMTSSLHHHSDGSENEQPENQSEAHTESSSAATGMSVPGTVSPNMHYAMPTQLGNGNAMTQTAYPYPDPYYRSIFAPYNAQPYHPQPYSAQAMLMGIQQAGVPLPSDKIDEPVFVNAKQYHGILRRRQSRAKAESEKKLLKARKPYLHESRHLHALKRARGCGGRFLTANKTDDQQKQDESGDKSHVNINLGSGKDGVASSANAS